jgi:hypothetical protein
MASPWHDDPGELSYKGIFIVSEDLGETLDDFGQAHYLDQDKLYSRPEYAAKAGLKVLGPNYLILVKVEMENGGIGWLIMITTNDVNDIFPGVQENE